MKPFANDSAAIAVGDLQIENGRDRIAIYGSLDLTRDQAGLALARDMLTLLGTVVKSLEADSALPAAIPAPKKPSTARNPFT